LSEAGSPPVGRNGPGLDDAAALLTGLVPPLLEGGATATGPGGAVGRRALIRLARWVAGIPARGPAGGQWGGVRRSPRKVP